MRRVFWITTLVTALTALGPAAWSQETPPASGGPDVLAAVPQDAWGVVTIRNLAGLEKKIMEIGTKFGAPPMSPLMMAKGALGLLSGVDDAGDLVLIVMPFDAFPQLPDSMVLCIPTTNFAELTSLMELQEVEAGISKTTIQGEEVFIAPKGKHALLAPSVELAKKVLSASEGVRFAPHVQNRMQEDDLAIWVNTDAVLNSQAATPFFAMLQAAGNPAAADSLKGLKTALLGLQLENTGIRLGFYVEAKEGTETAKAMADVAATDGSLLTGLPRDPYVLALGGISSQSGSAYAAEQVATMFDNPQLATAPVDQTKMSSLKELIKSMVSKMRALSVEISALPPGAEGLVGLVKIVQVDGDAKEMLTSASELVGIVKGGLITDEEANKYLQHLQYQSGAETIGEMSVDHLSFKITDVEGVEAEWLEKITKVLGKDGILFRLAAVDADHLAVTFGGGAARLEAVSGLVKSKAAPLSEDAGIKRTAGALARNRSSEIYLAADNLVRLISDIQKAVGEDEPLPFQLPQINAPIGIVNWPAGKLAQQADVFIPMEVVTAAKDVVQSMMAPAPVPPTAEPPPTAAPQEGTEPEQPKE